MTEQILDFGNWKTNYPFLRDVWTTYNDFDNAVVDEGGKHFNLCSMILGRKNIEKSEYKDFCMKLMRNLGYFSEEKQIYAPTFERCNILYNWIYNSINNNKITVDIINKCFKEYTEHMSRGRNYKICDRDEYYQFYEEPIKMTLLYIFENNMKNIKNILLSPDDTNKTQCRKFVCECVKIYKNIYNSYCNNTIPEDDKRKNTCDKLNTLKTIYKQHIFHNEKLMNKVPSLDGKEQEFRAMCKPDEVLRETTAVAGPELSTFPNSDQNRGEKLHQSFPSKEDDGENQSSRMSSTVSTALGTVAGASSILALLYKFSPARRWVHSGIRGNSGRMNSNFYEDGPTDLLFDGVQGEDMNSYNTRYNIGYGSV